MSLLWTKVPPLTLDSPLSPDTLDIWLPHARHRTLDFDLFAEGFNEDAIQAVIGALTSHANRWRSMEIYTNRFSAMIKVSASLPSHAGNLEQLILNCGAHDDLHDPEIIRRDNDVLRMKAPRLRNLYLEDFPCVPFGFLFHRYFPKLERLDLVGSSLDSLMIPGNDPYARRPSVLMKTLTALPHLRYLRIASLSLHGIYEATPETDRAILPALQEVEFKDAHLEHTITVLEAMEAPQLRFMSCIYPRSDDDFDDESPIMHDHLHHFPRFRMLKVIPDRTFTVNEYLSRFVGDLETVDFICGMDCLDEKIADLINLAGSGEFGDDWSGYFPRLIGLDIHKHAFGVTAATLRKIVNERLGARYFSSFVSGAGTDGDHQPPTALEEIHVCTSTQISAADRSWFAESTEVKCFSWSDSASCLAEEQYEDGRNHEDGWLRLTFAVSYLFNFSVRIDPL
ncbi:hypothetical protein SCP_0600540 [Sparassis crispa]|uniref:F-box domain-containing protein n=1 Tax=Sparassis crispa TaxID=139825 RepID=A0A401GPD3_9APHY|nr:hypothetical protein SCP_0600540 [Sparassis crispa]GBE84076.1 hypothetical protein SCP_0600540 [Sparassis crispa]